MLLPSLSCPLYSTTKVDSDSQHTGPDHFAQISYQTIFHLPFPLSLQGDYDPSKTKIISFSQNPASLARQHRGEEVKRLKEEVETLRQRVQVLEEGGASDDVTQIVTEKMKESTSKEVEGKLVVVTENFLARFIDHVTCDVTCLQT